MSDRIGHDVQLSPEQQALVISVERMVHQVVNELVPWAKTPEQREEPLSAGRWGAARAARRYRSSYGTRFTSYAGVWIAGAVRRWMRAEAKESAKKKQAAMLAGEYLAEEPDTFNVVRDEPRVNRGRAHDATGRVIAALFAGVTVGPMSPEEAALAAERRAVVDEALAGLEPGKREAFERRFLQGQPLKEIVDGLGVADRTARRWIEDALDAISAAVRAKGLRSDQ